jgi:hypothetical protein
MMPRVRVSLRGLMVVRSLERGIEDGSRRRPPRSIAARQSWVEGPGIPDLESVVHPTERGGAVAVEGEGQGADPVRVGHERGRPEARVD